jgi:ubiquinone/menaquinone biosynthesis C-methylase UbiE
MAEDHVPSSTYTRDYYESHCAGHLEFLESGGRVLPPRLRVPLELGAMEPGMCVLDVGCGRGELLLHTARAGATSYGVDYAQDAVRIARETFERAEDPVRSRICGVQRADAGRLPYMSHTFDRVFMLDIVEHLYPAELREALSEAYRVLRPGGAAVVHTMPNLWYYRFGYPLYRSVQRLRGVRLPANPRERWAYHHVHVNEQTPVTLRRALRGAGFTVKVRLVSIQTYEYERNRLVRAGMHVLTQCYPYRWLFCNDILAVARKA